MNVKELVKDLARRFAALGADHREALYNLEQKAEYPLSRILDKYGRFVPADQNIQGFKVRAVGINENVFFADIAIETDGATVEAAKVLFDPSAVV